MRKWLRWLAEFNFHGVSAQAINVNNNNEYEALTPSILGPEESAIYVEAINFACSQDEIKNIAVTGAYGAGKSSVLLTWRECPDNDFHIMTVSLADFAMQSSPKPKPEHGGKEETGSPADEKKAAEEKTIEYSILQQMLYQAKKSALPYSRIERISITPRLQIAARAGELLLIVSLALAGLFCLFPDYFRNKFALTETISHYLLDSNPAYRLAGAGLLFFTAFYRAFKALHRIGLFDRRLSVDKIDMFRGAISTRPSAPSLLNIYIDEIVYFFEATGHNVVIFEDLDRHNDGAIFIKLREINQIINNTRPEKERVRFIYAVRDGLFTTAEARSKFFDFVIPVIPVMDSENAAEHFKSMFRPTELETEGFIQCISRLSFFIPDMRIMRNIANEFRIFHTMVNGAGDITRLLSMITYKNICAEDYHGIDEKKGVLYSFVSAFSSGELKSRYNHIQQTKIEYLKEEIESMIHDEAATLTEIRENILAKYILPNQKDVLSFNLASKSIVDFDSLSRDEDFTSKFEGIKYFHIRFNARNTDLILHEEKEIKTILAEYKERTEKLRLKSTGRLYEIERDIEDLEYNKLSLKNASLPDITSSMGIAGFTDWVNRTLYPENAVLPPYQNSSEQLEFIYFLLVNGYITSGYMFYRSVFRPGSLSTEDNEFIKAVSIGRNPEQTLSMPLHEIENVVSKLNSLSLIMKRSAWHPDVLLYLLGHNTLTLREIIQIQIADSEDTSLAQLTAQTFENWPLPQRILYVEEMSTNRFNASVLVKRLAEMDDKNVASELLLLHLCSSRLKWNEETTDMRQWSKYILVNNGQFPDEVPEGYAEVFKDNLLKTGLIFPRLADCSSEQGKDIVRSIVDHQRWEYSAGNIKNIFLTLCADGKSSRKYFEEKPLSAIESLGIPALVDTVRRFFDIFLNDFFVLSQDYSHIPALLNDSDVSEKGILGIVTKMQFIIDDIRTIINRELILTGEENIAQGNNLHSLLLKHNHVDTKWSQLSFLLVQSNVSDVILGKWFEKYHDLFQEKYVEISSMDSLNSVLQRLYNSAELTASSRKKILSNFHVTFLFLPENLPPEKVALMVEYGRLAPTAAVFTEIRDTYTDNDEGVSEILASLVSQYPALLTNHPLTVLVHDDEPDFPLAERLFSNDEVMKSAGISTLNSLWGYDPDVFEGPLFIPAESLRHIVPELKNDDLRLALLLQALSAGELSHQIITLVLSSLSEDDYRVFLSTKAHRSVPYTKALIKMARLLEKAGFIQSLNVNEARQRIRFVPHCSSAFRHH